MSEDVIFVTKDISCEFKCKLDERKCNLDQWWNNDICPCKCKSHHICEKEYVWDTALWSCGNGQYLTNIMYDSVIMCDDIIDVEAESCNEETNLNE